MLDMTKIQKPNIKFSKLTLFVIILMLLAVSVIIFNDKLQNSNKISDTQYKEVKIATSSAAITPTPTPTPTPKPKPQYVGFCLKVPILLYHHIKSLDSANSASLTVDTNTFDAQMQYLINQGYHTISIDELVQALINKQALPPKSIAITIDDGYDDFYLNAYPILYKYQLKANLMIATGLLGNAGYLSWDDLKRMIDTGYIFAYDHTWSHASLTALADEKIRYEILTGKQQLEERLGRVVNIFSYPYGSQNQKVIDILKQNGFIAALSTIPGFTQCDSLLMSLSRNRVGNAPLTSLGL